MVPNAYKYVHKSIKMLKAPQPRDKMRCCHDQSDDSVECGRR